MLQAWSILLRHWNQEAGSVLRKRQSDALLLRRSLVPVPRKVFERMRLIVLLLVLLSALRLWCGSSRLP